jgi:oxygen-independent coproporphyrinogen-3 oxidase
MSSIYLHIPFCEKKCLYCDFYSIESRSGLEDFLAALVREIRAYSSYGRAEEFQTLFFGGGTPSLLHPDQLGEILAALHEVFRVTPDAEITLEANPGTIDRRKLEGYRELGVNRLSIGIQSFDEAELKFLSRIHTRDQALAAIDDARGAGFANISIDLMYSLPGQTLPQWEQNLRTAVDLAPHHISAYSLIVEEQTPLAKMVETGRVIPASTDADATMYEFTMSFLSANGYEQYEVSNYARKGYRCRHNIAYWSHLNYLGFGPSAHSFWREPAWTEARRWWNIANIRTYNDRLLHGKLPVASEEQVSIRDLINERIFLGLRSNGLDLAKTEKDFRFAFHDRQRVLIRELAEKGLAVLEDGTLRLTPSGYLLCDEVAERLFL